MNDTSSSIEIETVTRAWEEITVVLFRATTEFMPLNVCDSVRLTPDDCRFRFGCLRLITQIVFVHICGVCRICNR